MRLAAELGVAFVGSCVTTRASTDRRAHWSDLYGTVIDDPELLVLLHPEISTPPMSSMHAIFQDGRSPDVSQMLYLRH